LLRLTLPRLLMLLMLSLTILCVAILWQKTLLLLSL